MARKKNPKADSPAETALAPQGAPDLLLTGRIRALNDVVDLAAEVSGALMRGEMPTSTAREVRQWAELMYTCIQAQQSNSDGDVNFIGQLIQIAGGEVAVEASRSNIPKKTVESQVIEAAAPDPTPKLEVAAESEQLCAEVIDLKPDLQDTADLFAEAFK